MALPFADHAIEMIGAAPLLRRAAMVYLAFFSSALGFVFWSYAFEHALKSFGCNQLYVSISCCSSYSGGYTYRRNSDLGLYIGA